jgi:hypothetical protein
MRIRLAIVGTVLFSTAFILPASAQPVSSIDETLTSTSDTNRESTQATAPPPKVVVDYSDGYRMRAKIHKISSFATLPLFATEAVLGQSLYSDPSSGKKDAHLAVAAGIGTLFAVNSVTGVWNLIEARKDPVHRKLRLAHGLMMLGADAGFVATAALGPSSEHGESEGSRGAHRAMAFTSIGLATASYLIMLFGSH